MFEGIIPPIITPFHDDMSVDEKGYADVIEYMIANGVHAIIVGGTTGENYALSSEERVRQFTFARTLCLWLRPLSAVERVNGSHDGCSARRWRDGQHLTPARS